MTTSWAPSRALSFVMARWTWVRTVSGLTTSLVGRGRRRGRAEADGAEHRHPEEGGEPAPPDGQPAQSVEESSHEQGSPHLISDTSPGPRGRGPAVVVRLPTIGTTESAVHAAPRMVPGQDMAHPRACGGWAWC